MTFYIAVLAFWGSFLAGFPVFRPPSGQVKVKQLLRWRFRVFPSHIVDDRNDTGLRVAFDFDGVITDDESEKIYQQNNDINEFYAHEQEEAPLYPASLVCLPVYEETLLMRKSLGKDSDVSNPE